MKLETIWVVTYPTAESVIEDIVFNVDAQGFFNQIRGGLTPDEIEGFYADESEATAVGHRLLNQTPPAARRAAPGRMGGKKMSRFSIKLKRAKEEGFDPTADEPSIAKPVPKDKPFPRPTKKPTKRPEPGMSQEIKEMDEHFRQIMKEDALKERR